MWMFRFTKRLTLAEFSDTFIEKPAPFIVECHLRCNCTDECQHRVVGQAISASQERTKG